MSWFPYPYNPYRVNSSGLCEEPTCPVREVHAAGIYLHDGVLGPQSEWFGNSCPPPEIWDAVKRMLAGAAGFEELLKVRRFRRYHYNRSRF